MLISVIFIFTLSCTFTTPTSAGTLNAVHQEHDDDGNGSSSNGDTPMHKNIAVSSKQTLTTTLAHGALAGGGDETAVLLFDAKLEAFTAALNRIDASVQNLQEKSHGWAILRHHIDAWNDEMKVTEQKLELLRGAQRQQENKLMSMELTLNHVLSKVIYLSDGCPKQQQQQQHQLQQQQAAAATEEEADEQSPSAPHVQSHSNNNNNKNQNQQLLQVQGEMSSRLNNIMRHLQSIEKKQNAAAAAAAVASEECRRLTSDAVVASTSGGAPQRPAAASSTTTTTTTTSAGDIGSQSAIAMSLPIKEIKQLHSLAKKNAKLLEHIMQKANNADEHCSGMARNVNRRIDSIAGELATFTGSSDLLLKRIESLLRVVVHNKGDEHTDAKTKREDTEHTRANDDDDDDDEDNNEDTENDNDIDNGDGDEDDDDGNGDESHDHHHLREDNEQDNEVGVVEDIDGDVNTNELDEQHTNEIGAKLHTYFRPNQQHCHELNRAEAENGIYTFGQKPQFNEANRDFYRRLCVFGNPNEDSGPAWTVIQNRGPYNVQENFNRSWHDYRTGFGSLEHDFWYGNEFVYQLLAADDYVLRVELTDDQGSYGWAEYTTFRLDSEEYNYNLMIGGFSSNGLPDAMQFNNEQDFSTYDRRNDKSVDACCPCALTYASGWWFDRCSEANLNGIYRNKAMGHNYVGIIWQDWPYEDYSLHTARLLIRPRDNSQLHEDP